MPLEGLPGGVPLVGAPKQPVFVLNPETGEGSMRSSPGLQEFPAVCATLMSDQVVAQIANLCCRMVIGDLVRLGVIVLPEQPDKEPVAAE